MVRVDDKRGVWLSKELSGVTYYYDPRVEDRLPEPFSISGSIVNGSDLIVRGGGGVFGDKFHNQNPVYDNFNDYTPDSLLKVENPAWVAYQNREGAIVSSTVSRTGNSVCNNSARHGFDTNFIKLNQTEEVFLSYWMYFEADVDSEDYAVGKLCRITSSVSAGGGGEYNGAGAVALSNMNPRGSVNPVLLHDTGGAPQQTPPESGAGYLEVPFNQWVRINMHCKLNDVDQPNGKLMAESVGLQKINYSDRVLRASSQSFKYDTILLGLMFANVEGGPMSLMIDEVYIDTGLNSASRFELVQGVEWSEQLREKEIQPYSSWNSTEVTLKQNHGVLSGLCSLWFVSSNGSVFKIAEVEV